jgi:hypothetical protein
MTRAFAGKLAPTPEMTALANHQLICPGPPPAWPELSERWYPST